MTTKYAIFLLLFIIIICILYFIIFSNYKFDQPPVVRMEGFKEGATPQSSPSSSSPSPSSSPSSTTSLPPAEKQVSQQDCLALQQTTDVQDKVKQATESAQKAATSATNAAQYASKASQYADQAETAVKSLTGDTVEVQLANNAKNNAVEFAKKSAQYSKSAMASSDAASFQASQAQDLMTVQNLSKTAGTNAQFADYTYQAQMYSQYAQQSSTNAEQQEHFALEAQKQSEQQSYAAQQAAKAAQAAKDKPPLSAQQIANSSVYCAQKEIPVSPPKITTTAPTVKPTKKSVFNTSSPSASMNPTQTTVATTPAIMKKSKPPGSTDPSASATPSVSDVATTPSIMKTSKPPGSTIPSKTTDSSQMNNYYADIELNQKPFDKDASRFFKTSSNFPTTTPYVKRDLVDQQANFNQIPLPTQISTNADFLNVVNSVLNLPSNLSIDKIALNVIQGLLSSMRSSNATILMNEVIQNYNAEPRSILQYMNWFASTCPVDCNSCN